MNSGLPYLNLTAFSLGWLTDLSNPQHWESSSFPISIHIHSTHSVPTLLCSVAPTESLSSSASVILTLLGNPSGSLSKYFTPQSRLLALFPEWEIFLSHCWLFNFIFNCQIIIACVAGWVWYDYLISVYHAFFTVCSWVLKLSQVLPHYPPGCGCQHGSQSLLRGFLWLFHHVD